MSTGNLICKLARFGLTTANAAVLANFYESALGFERIRAEHLGGTEFENLMRVRGGADAIILGLGEEIVELLQFEFPGHPYPAGSSASDLLFQHFAIVVSDMEQAWQRLRAAGGWSAITRDAPQLLPKTAGGVSAFKFRDPDGHPLELLAFPTGNAPSKWRKVDGNAIFLGIDHSALSVADTVRSSAFYEHFGFKVSAHSFNHGKEQDALDGIPEVQVEVTALASADSNPHIEILCYRSTGKGRPLAYNSNDIAATRLILEHSGSGAESRKSAPSGLLDPDGHHLIIRSHFNRRPG